MKKRVSPYLLIILSFIFLVLIGSILLILPIATKQNIKYVEALFTAGSAVTITGLTTISVVDNFTSFGKIVIAILIQLGGLSVTTVTLFIMTILGTRISHGGRELAKESLNVDSVSGIIKGIKKIVTLALTIELIGTVLITLILISSGFSFKEALAKGAFHTISAYNNAGFDIFGNNSLIMFKDNVLFNIVTILLIILGGIGSIVIIDILNNKRWRKLSFHSKIVIKMTLTLFIFGALSFFILEKDVTILQSFFHSATIRTAGFNTINYNLISKTSIIIMILLMYIGGAPASNAGGIKLTTAFTLYKTSIGFAKQKEVTTYKRKIPEKYQIKSFMMVFFSMIIIFVSALFLSIMEKNLTIDNIFFEIVNSFSNTGINLGNVENFHALSKIYLVIVMLIGRIGILTFISLISYNKKAPSNLEYIDLNYLV